MANMRPPGVTGLKGAGAAAAVLDAGTLCRAASPGPGGGGGGVAGWPADRKLLQAARRTTPLLPEHMRDQFAALFEPANIAITAGVLTAWLGSHYVGIGFVAD